MLAPCPSCGRHARLGPACPFCNASTDAAVPGAVHAVSRRAFTRAAVVAGAAVLASCRGEPRGDDDSSGGEDPHPGGGGCDDDGNNCAPYGAPPVPDDLV